MSLESALKASVQAKQKVLVKAVQLTEQQLIWWGRDKPMAMPIELPIERAHRSGLMPTASLPCTVQGLMTLSQELHMQPDIKPD